MSPEILTAIISAVTTLLVSIGTWHVSMRQYREKNEKMVDGAIDAIKDSVTSNNAQVQEHLAIIDLKIETLSDRVDKHNNLVERMYAVEKSAELNEQEIEHLKEKFA